MNTNTQSVTPAHTSVPPHKTLQRARAGDGERMSQGLEENSRRERMRQGKVAEVRRERREEEERQRGRRGRGRHEGGSLVNVSPASPGPERRAADSRTMATGSIQKARQL